jgi:hypothetical protein
MTSRHVQVKVSSAQDMGDNALEQMFGGRSSDIRTALIDMEKNGQIYIDTEGCDNYHPDTHSCLGHATQLSDIEVTAEVFKVIRANQDMPVKSIMKAVKEHLPEVTDERIRIAIGDLL